MQARDGVAAIGEKIIAWAKRPEARMWAAGVVSALGVILLGSSPTGAWWSDLVTLTALSTVVMWAGRRTPWWLIAGCALIPLGLAPIGLGTALAVIAIVTTSLNRDIWRINPLVRDGTLVTLIWAFGLLRPFGPTGTPTLISIVALSAVAVVGAAQRPTNERRQVARLVLWSGGVCLIAVILSGALAWWARSDLERGRDAIEVGLADAADADLDGAQDAISDAAGGFRHARWKLSNPITWTARLVPGVGQNLGAASAVSGAASDFTGEVVSTIETLKMVDISESTVDLDTINTLVDDAKALPDRIESVENTVADVRSPWLVAPLDRALDTIGSTLEERSPTIERYASSADLMPRFLGADGPRHYLIMFTTPAEARGPGGFMGNFAEITIDEGRIELTRFGRTTDLEAAMTPGLTLQDAPPDWLARYRRWGMVYGENDEVASDAWAIINLSPHFPSTAQVVAELYAGSGGNQLDGVFSLDVYGLQAIVDLVGPIEVDGAPTLTGENTAEFLLLDQYAIDVDNVSQRADMLSAIADEALTKMLVDAPPSPLDLGTALVPLVRQRRVLAWALEPNDQAVLAEIGMTGALFDERVRTVDGAVQPAFEIVLNNGAGNKVDSFLRRKITVDGTTVTVELTNTAPSSGLPEYVIGNAGNFDEPPGTNIANVTIYSTERLVSLTLSGEQREVRVDQEAGAFAYDLRESILPNETFTIIFETASPDNVNVLQPLAYEVDES